MNLAKLLDWSRKAGFSQESKSCTEENSTTKHTRLIWTASSYDVARILFIPNNSDHFQSQCGRNEIGQVECYQSVLNLLPCRDKCTGFMCNYTIMVESKSYCAHPVQSLWSIAILALAAGKRTGLFVGVRYIYLRKNVELWWRVERCYLDIHTEEFNIKC